MQPDCAEKAAFIATTPRTKPWASAFNESQRMAIECDPTFGERSAEAGLQGMATARSIALMSYRGGMAYDKTQEDENPDEVGFQRRVLSYQRYQGEKLRRRFNAYSYYRLSQAVDSLVPMLWKIWTRITSPITEAHMTMGRKLYRP